MPRTATGNCSAAGRRRRKPGGWRSRVSAGANRCGGNCGCSIRRPRPSRWCPERDCCGTCARGCEACARRRDSAWWGGRCWASGSARTSPCSRWWTRRFCRRCGFPGPSGWSRSRRRPRRAAACRRRYPNFVDWEKPSQSFESMGILGVFQEALKKAGGNERVPVGYVSPGFHGVLGVRAVRGRLLSPADDSPGAPPAAVLAHRF